MRILITGGAGYIGTALVYELAQKDNVSQITIYDNLSRNNRNIFLGNVKLPSKVKFIQADILDSRTLSKALNDADVVYHLAAKVTTPFSDQTPHLFEQVNHWGTAELINLILQKNNIKKFIYLSSISVYGAGDDEITNITILNPKTFYGISKLRGEEQVKLLEGKVPYYILRCGNVYGYGKSMRFDAVINHFMFDANFKNKISIDGNGEQYRAFININELKKTLTEFTNSIKLAEGIYNLVERNLSVNEIAATLKQIYPELEMIYINQNLNLRQLKAETDARLKNVQHLSKLSLKEELELFKSQFSF